MPKKVIDTPCNNLPVWGYRFVITGHFKANGKKQVLTEHYYSRRDEKETNKFYTCITDIWNVIDSSDKKDNDSYFLCSDPSMDTLRIGGFIGPLFLKNEGDLDGDGLDELSFVPSTPQQSSENQYHIISYKNNKWVQLYAYEIREWQLPSLPEGGIEYGMFGRDGMYSVTNDSLNTILIENLKNFHGLLHKMKNGKLRIETFDATELGVVSKIADLRKIKPAGL